MRCEQSKKWTAVVFDLVAGLGGECVYVSAYFYHAYRLILPPVLSGNR